MPVLNRKTGRAIGFRIGNFFGAESVILMLPEIGDVQTTFDKLEKRLRP